MANMYSYEIMGRHFLWKELARQKIIGNAFKVKLNQNQDVKLKFESDSFNNAFSKSAKTPIQRKGRFTVN